MPLHDVIPLCNFKYVRDTFSGATFKYDTTCNINKEYGPKTTYVDVLIEIDKVATKRMYKETLLVDKATNTRLMYKEAPEIDKPMVKRSLMTEDLQIYIEHDSELEKENASIIDKLDQKELIDLLIPELNKNDQFELECQLREIDQQKSIQCEGVTPLLLDEFNNTFLEKELNCIDKVTSMNLDGYDSINVEKMNHKYLIGQLILELNKERSTCLQRESLMDVDINIPNIFIQRVSETICNKYDDPFYFNVINELDIVKDESDRYSTRLNGQENITKDDSVRHIRRHGALDIKYDNHIKFINRDVITSIDQFTGGSAFERLTINQINKDESMMDFSRVTMKSIDQIPFDYLLDRISITPIFNTDSERSLDRMHIVEVLKDQENYLDRLQITDIFKLDLNYMNHIPIIPIYKENPKPIFDVTIMDIYKDLSKSLKETMVKDIYLPRENKYIEVTKRWWWLDDSSPRDRKIVPNRDYKKMKDLLSNPNYEYLRYTNHPIDWGKHWGIDNNIPPDAISIEIMLDITNIITMIWHKSAHGWLRVTGKEGIQLLMELLYDWYSMSTSYPNSSYYRAYRWVRWEAEKVYFLNTTSGLQAIGILVKNLRDYLKFHHFNRVPIWRNPKAMDEERNFNRLAQNGDLMVDLNKTKSKRHYYIETQNFEKKNKLRSE